MSGSNSHHSIYTKGEREGERERERERPSDTGTAEQLRVSCLMSETCGVWSGDDNFNQ